MLILCGDRIAARTEPVEHLDLCIYPALCINEQYGNLRVELGSTAQEQAQARLGDLCGTARFALDHHTDAIDEGYHIQVSTVGNAFYSNTMTCRDLEPGTEPLGNIPFECRTEIVDALVDRPFAPQIAFTNDQFCIEHKGEVAIEFLSVGTDTFEIVVCTTFVKKDVAEQLPKRILTERIEKGPLAILCTLHSDTPTKLNNLWVIRGRPRAQKMPSLTAQHKFEDIWALGHMFSSQQTTSE